MVKRHYGIRTDRYKLIHYYYDIDEWELFDLQKDPMEMVNVYEDHSYRSIKKKLHNGLIKLGKEYGDSETLMMKMLDDDLKRIEPSSKQ